MCGRFARWTITGEPIEEFDHLRLPPAPFQIPVTHNIAPQSMQPVIRVDPETGQPAFALMKWGLVPFWAKESKIGHTTINARSEDIEKKPVFREAFRRRRCLVPANVFYEWQTLSPRVKQPHAIALADSKLFAFAGLWDRWKSPEGIVLESFTILTTFPNELIERLHNRMPCILDPGEYLRWLEPGNPAQPPTDLLRPYPAEKMLCWPVGARVGNARNDDPSLCKPVEITAPSADTVWRS